MLVIPEILPVSPSPAQWSMWGCDFRVELRLQPPVSLAMTLCGAQGQGMWQRGR